MAYYKGPIIAGEMITRVLFALDLIRAKRNMNIVLIAHDGLQQGANALGDDFKKWAPNVSKYAWNRVRDWCDQIGHAQSKNDGGKIKLLFEEFPDIFKDVRLIEIGGALGVHTGPGAISVALQKIND